MKSEKLRVGVAHTQFKWVRVKPVINYSLFTFNYSLKIYYTEMFKQNFESHKNEDKTARKLRF